MSKKIILLAFILILATFGLVQFAFAETCPLETTVSGTNITFVGGVTDMGNDAQVSVWFEYGTTSGSYVQKTEEKVVTQLGKYCIIVSNLNPCTTYYYRAGVKNQGGVGYGEEKSRTTVCSSPEEVLGAATGVSTGLTNNILADSFILPLALALSLVFFLKLHILKWEEWLDERKKEYRKFKTDKLLKLKIAQIKAWELFNKK